MAQPDSLAQTLRSASIRHGGIFLGSRAANGAFAIVQVLLVTRAVGPTDAGRYFLLWTAAWLLSVVLKFGVDGILPRAVAEARLAGLEGVAIVRVLGAGLIVGAALLPFVMTLLGLPLEPLEIALVVGLAVSWAANGILAALLKAHGRADLSGLVANIVWPVGPTLAPLIVLVAGGGWETVAWLTLALSALSLGGAAVLAIRGLGVGPVLHLASSRGLVVPVERDEVGAAVLTTLYEVIIWLPVLLGGLLDIPPAAAAGLFAATRVAGVFSWGYQAVVIVLAPRIAGAFAARDAATARTALRRGSLAGMAVTWPACLVGALLAGPVLGVLDASYDEWTDVLQLLILARAIDAATGPLGEALLVGRRTWVDVAIVLVGVAIGAVAAEVLYDPVGEVAIGIGAAGAFIALNLLRLAYVQGMLNDLERTDRKRRSSVSPLLAGVLSVAAVCLGGALAVVSLAEPPSGAGGVGLSIGAAALVAFGLIGLGVSQFGWRATLTSPLVVVVVVLLCVFAIRPASLLVDPRTAAPGLVSLGFDWEDLTATVGIGVLGFLAFGAAFALGWRLTARTVGHDGRIPDDARIIRGAAAALGAGTLLWGPLFLRNGGFRALIDDPASLHLGQFSGGYGVFGYMLCLAAALVVLWALLRRPSRLLAMTLGVAVLVSVAAAFALQTRGPLLASMAAAAVIVVVERRLTGRQILALMLAGLVLAVGFAYMRTLREYNQTQSLGDAVADTARTDPLTVVGGEFGEVESFVALRQLVPDGLPWLDGRSLADVPAAFVPREFWGGKPKPIDFALADALYGPTNRAGTPFTLAGELFWNFRLAGVLVGMTVLGLLAGIGWSALRRLGGAVGVVAGAALVGYSYLLLTRPLGPMLLTAAMALGALAVVAFLVGVVDLPARVRRLRAVASR